MDSIETGSVFIQIISFILLKLEEKYKNFCDNFFRVSKSIFIKEEKSVKNETSENLLCAMHKLNSNKEHKKIEK